MNPSYCATPECDMRRRVHSSLAEVGADSTSARVRLGLAMNVVALALSAGCVARGNEAMPPSVSTAREAAETLSSSPSTPTVAQVVVPAGTFLMGCTDGERVCRPGEGSREVMTHAFRVDTYETTVEEFAACVAHGACAEPASAAQVPSCNWRRNGHGQHPINCIEKRDAEAYCHWRDARLPTETEWEKAARGTDGRTFPWGNDPPDCERAVIGGSSGPGCGRSDTWPVGSKPAGASPYGAQDMAGNVAEWTASPFLADEATDSAEERYVVRGGALYFEDDFVFRASLRASRPVNLGGSIALGFRCVTTPGPTAPERPR